MLKLVIYIRSYGLSIELACNVCVFHMCLSKFQNTEYVTLNRTGAAGSFPPGLVNVPHTTFFQKLSLHVRRKWSHIHTATTLTRLCACMCV